MSLTIKIQRNKSDKDVCNKVIEDLLVLTGALREETSIVNPVILIETNDTNVFKANYLTIDDFGRHYYIKNIDIVRTGLIRISAHVDVLMTYKDQIKQCQCIVAKQENKYNLYLDDGTFRYYNNPQVVTKEFPEGFHTFGYSLVMAGPGLIV